MPLHSDSRSTSNGWVRYWLVTLFVAVGLFFSSTASPTALANRLPRSMVSPLSLSAAFIGKKCTDYFGHYMNNADSALALTAAREEIEQLKAQQLELNQLKQEVSELRTQLEFSESRKDLDLLPATVLARRKSEFSKRLTIEFSSQNAEQIAMGAPVVTADALIGQIIEIDGTRAEVMLLSDPRSAVDVQLSRSGVRGVAVGQGQEGNFNLDLKYMSQDVAIQDNDMLLTSGKDGKFPVGLPVGKVKKIDLDTDGAGTSYTIMPPSNFVASRYVFVVRGRSGLSADGSEYKEAD